MLGRTPKEIWCAVLCFDFVLADPEPLALLALTNLGPFKENLEAVDFDLVTVDSI